MRPWRPLTLLFVGLMLLAACSLPRSAPSQGELLSGADELDAPFDLHLVTRNFLPVVDTWPTTEREYSWISHQRGSASSIIAAGDLLMLSIWDNNENSLVTSVEQKVVDVANIKVTPEGTIYVPYVEEVYVTGLTPNQARQVIQREIDAILPSAQVLLSHEPGQRNRVDLVGGALKPGNYPLPDQNFTVLSLLSLGGGVPADMRNPQVWLHRNNQIYGTSLSDLYDTPSLDTTLRGGDKVIVDEDSRHFVALGASGRQEIVNFTQQEISASDAVSLIGGLRTARANPKGILILREYPNSMLSSDGRGPRKNQIVFTVDLTSADGVFSARKFNIESGDLVMVSESPITKVQTVFNLFGTLVGFSNGLSDFTQ